MKCIDCQHMTSGDSPSSKEMARHGFNHCAKDKSAARHLSMKWERQCSRFAAVPAEEVEKRINWLEKRNG